MSIAENSLQLKKDFDDVYKAGYDNGEYATRKILWDGLQNKGKAANYYYAFAYNRFDDDNFNPPYNIKSTNTKTGTQCIFYNNTLITDTKVEIIAGQDSSNCFYGMSNCHTIRKFTVNEETAFTGAFTKATSLVNIEIGGTIGQKFDIRWCTKLSKESIISIINALSETKSSLTVTFSEEAVNNSFTTDEWNELVATKSNWTISLV
jgi:hypothetical protein